MVMVTTVCDTNLSQRLSFDTNNNNHLREASFSSYLNHAEKEFVRKLAESSRDPSKSTIPTTQEEDGHIEVFGAEKYFNGGMDRSPNPVKHRPRKHHHMTTERLDLKPNKPNISRSVGTPSVRSQSSLNSEKALLQNPRPAKPNKPSQSKGFLYKCYCCDKSSVEVDADSKNAKQPTKMGLNFTFESSISRVGEAKTLPLKMQIQAEDDQQERKSIEVFGSSLTRKTISKTLNLEKRLSMLSWNDITPRVEIDKFSNEDAESDASSDLFEIESLTGKPNSFLARQGSVCTDCVTPTTCYAPSEASIEWSVITASAADFSIMSDYDERRLSTTSPVRNMISGMVKSNDTNHIKENQRRRSNLLMGCNSQKAVRVARDGRMASEKVINSDAQVQQRSESFGRLTRFEAEAKVIGFDSSQRQLATSSLPWQYSPRISSILYS